jgi:hypothetical protein
MMLIYALGTNTGGVAAIRVYQTSARAVQLAYHVRTLAGVLAAVR